MLPVRKLRDLTLRAPSAPERPPFLSAASSLVAVQSFLYVVADDELHLGVFPAEGTADGKLVRLLEGELPDGRKKRKRHKPDFEAQVLLPAFAEHPYGALLAIGSGSKRNRRGSGLPAIDLGQQMSVMEDAVGTLNLEGAVVIRDDVVEDRIAFFQRGNKEHAVNAVISVRLDAFLHALGSGVTVDAIPFDVCTVDLGATGGVPWGFTDAAALPDGRIAFTAVAEDTEDAYLDGPCAGAAVGVLDRQGQVLRFEELSPLIKAEGIHARIVRDQLHLLLVTDADDPDVPASLWEGQLAHQP